ncbi:Uncharacterized [Moorella glycerini]|uniref:Uncharacterized protein n=1 Tax=Neomoorella stamsii TaxID=1266720 RepID=A0A9X7J502_9FIRM|nr:hypothetical protein MOST_06630 [Moorella stamsii]CEP68352.1 Uncharacterized [Moorella glycerini]
MLLVLQNVSRHQDRFFQGHFSPGLDLVKQVVITSARENLDVSGYSKIIACIKWLLAISTLLMRQFTKAKRNTYDYKGPHPRKDSIEG